MNKNTKEFLETNLPLVKKKILTKGNYICSFPSSLLYFKKQDPKYQAALEILVKAESFFPGGAEILVKKLQTQEDFLGKSISVSVPNKLSVNNILQRFSSKTKSLLESSFLLSGPNGKIFVEQSQNDEVSLELKESSTFECISRLGNFSCLEAKIATIDGYIESVSELNLFLSEASTLRENFVIVARGFSDDVLNTLSVNNKRGSILVRPLEIKLEHNTLNSLKDISVISGSKLITSDKGDLISSLSASDCGQVDKVVYTFGELEIFSNSRKLELESHVLFLRKKLEESSEDAVRDLLTARVRRLNSRRVIVRIPKTLTGEVLRREFEDGIREISCVIRHGSLTDKDLSTILSPLAKNLVELLESDVI